MDELRTLAELNEANVERAKSDLHLAYTTYPELLYPVLFPPCTVRILMVTDGSGSFTDADFGLTELLDVLSVSPGPYVRFAVTKAHRRATANGGPTGADINNFRFDTADLSPYHEIWMFAVERGSGSITDPELSAISKFMDDGGGVFATGDHEDLGVVMCGKLPRVRSMRKWHWPDPGPFGEPVAPPVGGPQRHDTNRTGHADRPQVIAFSPTFSPTEESSYPYRTEFDDQSDDIPQTIQPKLYFAPSPYVTRGFAYPHPLLCGPKGGIRYLPDHPHEGECYVPADLATTFTFAGETFTEYRALPDGTRLAPEVIATSTNGPGISDFGKGPVAVDQFGAIGAYNGHEVNVGRVVVDATWHHFFNVNLKGDPTSEYAKRMGFYATQEGLDRYAQIKTYFRNIGVWLATPERHRCMRWRAIWATRWHSRLAMDFRAYARLDEIPLREFTRIGIVALDVLGWLASQCQGRQWISDLAIEAELPRKALAPISPWPPRPDPPPDFDPITTHYSEALLDASLGAIMYTLVDRYPEPGDADRKRLEEREDREVISDGVRMAASRVVEAARKSQSAIDEMLEPEEDRRLE